MGDAAEPHVDAALLEGRGLLQAGQLHQRHLHARPGGAVAADDFGQLAIQGGADEADAEAAALGLLQAAHHGPHLLDAVQYLDGLLV